MLCTVLDTYMITAEINEYTTTERLAWLAAMVLETSGHLRVRNLQYCKYL